MAPASYDFSGIVSTADQSEAIYLPLKSLNVHIFIADVSARVMLSQLYQYHGSDTLSETYYVFPVPANAAVCSFEMKSTNGARLKGVVKELSQAKEEYQEALSKGWLTGLLEQFRQDVFVVSIGSMPPKTDVTVLLSYVVDLSGDDQIDTVRFQLSTHVRARSGAPVNSAVYHDSIPSGPLSITVDIEMPGDILDVTSWNHNPLIDLPVPGASHSGHCVRKQFDSEDFDFGQDFLLTVHALGLGRPRCFVERLSHEENSLRSVVGPTAAFALTIVPRFDMKVRLAQEYIFLIDRSSSMRGSNIDMAKQALELLLNQLPSTNSMFNIYSFGWAFQSIWQKSMPCTHATLLEATGHINNMRADMGPGTELLKALSHIFLHRRENMPTGIFVLTDGEVYDPDKTIKHVRQAVSKGSQSGAPLRVFALGIGSGASTALCQGLAAAGDGSHLMTVEGGPLAIKAKQLVSSMQTPQVSDISIDWGALNLVPYRMPALLPGMRLLVTDILPGEQVPTEVTLNLRMVDGTLCDYKVPVEPISHHIPSSLTDALGGVAEIPPLIHTMNAHRFIQDVEVDETPFLKRLGKVTVSPETKRDIVKRHIVELGTRYQIASSHTAFIAVAAPNPPVKPPKQNRSSNRGGSRSAKKSGKKSATSAASAHSTPSKGSSSNPETSSKSDDEGSKTPRGKAKSNPSTTHKGSPASQQSSKGSRNLPTHASTGKKGSISGTSQSPASGMPEAFNPQTHASTGKTGSSSVTSQSPTSGMRGTFRQSPDREPTGPGLFDLFVHKPSPESVPAAEVICVPDPKGGDPTVFVAPPLPRYTHITTIANSWLKTFKSFIFSKNPTGGPRPRPKRPASAFQTKQVQSIPVGVLTVARLQSFSGSFSGISGELSSLVDIPEPQLRGMAPPAMAYGADNDSVWATAIAVAYCRKRLSRHVALWEDMAEKAHDFGAKVCGSGDAFQNIVQEALKLFQV
ncbi:hypothetical protein JB92DRAFT_3111192 [Gautieria morchelliformis]|nr:hypothetical protein JB92DRAFT_3111192 [Gautieria morchelliformis]